MWDFCIGYTFIVGGGSLQIQIVLVSGGCLFYCTLLLFRETKRDAWFNPYIVRGSNVCTNRSNLSMILVLLTLTYRKRPKNDSTKKIQTTYKVIVL